MRRFCNSFTIIKSESFAKIVVLLAFFSLGAQAQSKKTV